MVSNSSVVTVNHMDIFNGCAPDIIGHYLSSKISLAGNGYR